MDGRLITLHNYINDVSGIINDDLVHYNITMSISLFYYITVTDLKFNH